jgi:hypothetical protein
MPGTLVGVRSIQSAGADAETHRGSYSHCGQGLLRLGDDLELLCSSRGFRAGGGTKFGKNGRDVVLDRSRREKETVGNLLIAVAAGQESDDVDFS